MNELPMNAVLTFQIVVIVAFVVLVPFGLWMKRDTERLREEQKQAFKDKHGLKDRTQTT